MPRSRFAAIFGPYPYFFCHHMDKNRPVGRIRAEEKSVAFDLSEIAPYNKLNEQVTSFYAKMDSSVIFKKKLIF